MERREKTNDEASGTFILDKSKVHKRNTFWKLTKMANNRSKWRMKAVNQPSGW